MTLPIPYIPGIGIPGVPFVGLGQDRFQQLEAGPSVAAMPPTTSSYFPIAVAAGVTVWVITRILDRVFLAKKR